MTKLLCGAGLAVGLVGSAHAGGIVLTGHDVLFHGGQAGFDTVVLDFLRGGDAKAGYDIAVVGGGVGSARFTGGVGFAGGMANGTSITLSGALSGYGSATYWRGDLASASDWTTILSADALVILSHTACGGCDSTNASSAGLNANAAGIATAFNAGMDIWGLSSASLGSFYNFLPPGATSTGASISGASGFVATAAGLAAGLFDGGPSMINGFPTHNQFPTFDSAFTVWEVRSGQDITLAIRDAAIIDDEIVIDDDVIGVPEPASMGLFGLGLLGLGWARRRKAA